MTTPNTSGNEGQHSGGVVVGSFAIIDAGYPRYAVVGPVSKVTAQRFEHPATYSALRTARSALREVLFSGTEAACAALAAKLTSSYALAEQERRAAYERHNARQHSLISKALGTAPGSVGEGEKGQ